MVLRMLGAQRKSRALIAVTALAVTGAAILPQSASANGTWAGSPPAPTIETVASGLTAPWGIDTGPFGTVFVAESGTGNIVKLWHGAQWSIATTSPGVTDVGFDAWWAVSHVIGAGEVPGPPSNTLGRAFLDGMVVTEADLGAFEAANNPDQGQTYGLVNPPAGCAVPPELASYTGIVDSNAYGVLALDNGLRLVADAAGNDIVKVDWSGNLSVVAVLPPIAKTLPAELETDEGAIPIPACLQGATYLAEPVPTSVVKGPDGWLYVSGLTGAPELPGSGVVFRVNPWTGESTVWQSGLTTAVDLSFDNWGRLYVAEVFGGDPAGAPGALKRIDTTWGPGGLVPTGVTTVATGADGVVTPLGVATDDWGAVYVTVNGLPQGDGPPTANGAVLKLTGF
jgi:hypothetical protein